VGIVGVLFALFTAGYMLGVWTSCLVVRQPQREYEEGVPVDRSSARLAVLAAPSRVADRLP
jgi:hypothetical protein